MIKRRNMAMQVFLMVITLGIYGLYWFYVTSKEIIEYKNLNGSPGLWTVLLFIPWIGFYAYYKHGEAVEAPTDGGINKWIIFILWWVFSPAVWFITQTELNKRVSQQVKCGRLPAGLRIRPRGRGHRQTGSVVLTPARPGSPSVACECR